MTGLSIDCRKIQDRSEQQQYCTMDGSVPSSAVSSGLAVDYPPNIERMFETFHQSPHGDFKPTFYNPFEIKHRRRTTKAQYRVLEEAYQENNKPAASARKQIANRLGMTARAVQVWFQNRRAKDKSITKGSCDSSGDASPDMCRNFGGAESGAGAPSPSMALFEEGIQAKIGRKRLCSASSLTTLTAQSDGPYRPAVPNMARRHSMPDMHPLAGQLPFRELHEAIFGKNCPVNTAEMLEESMGRCGEAAEQMRPLLRKNPNMANFFAYYLNLHQPSYPMGHNPTTFSMTPPGSSLTFSNGDPMISGDNRSSSQPMGATDMTAPSISAPGSSPSLSPEDIYQQLRELISMNQTPNQLLVESVANDLTDFDPGQLGMLLQEDKASRLSNMDLFVHNGDFSAMLLSPAEDGTSADPIFTSASDQYYFPPDAMTSQFH